MKKTKTKDLLSIIESVISETALAENEFSYKIAQAAMDGKKKVKIGDKEYPVKMSKEKAKKIVNEKDLNEKDTPHLKQYGAPQGSKRDKHLDYVHRLFKAADKLESEGKKAEAEKKRQRAYEAREKEEKSKGMSQHQWAHARVNSATPSKPWAVVKKSKRKKKKKKGRKKK